MDYLGHKLRDFGRKYGFMPYIKNSQELRDEFGYVDPRLRTVAYQVKEEIEDYFARTEGVVPYHWHKLTVNFKSLPSKLEYVVEQGRKVLKAIKGYLGAYARGWRNIYVHENLPELEDGGEILKYTLKHELFHSVQEEAGSFSEEPHWKLEGEASMFATEGFEDLDFQMTDKWFPYRNWTLSYVWRWGKKLTTSFRKKLKRIYEYFTPEELDEIV